MDELKIKSNFLKGIIKKILIKNLKKHIGDYVTDMSLNDMEITIDDGKVKIHIDADIEAKKEIISEVILKSM